MVPAAAGRLCCMPFGCVAGESLFPPEGADVVVGGLPAAGAVAALFTIRTFSVIKSGRTGAAEGLELDHGRSRYLKRSAICEAIEGLVAGSLTRAPALVRMLVGCARGIVLGWVAPLKADLSDASLSLCGATGAAGEAALPDAMAGASDPRRSARPSSSRFARL